MLFPQSKTSAGQTMLLPLTRYFLLLATGGPAEELEGEAQVAEGVTEEGAAAGGAIVIGGLILRPIHRFHPPPPPPATVGLGFHAMQCECLRLACVGAKSWIAYNRKKECIEKSPARDVLESSDHEFDEEYVLTTS